jgi:hypothetical protein
MGVKGHENLPRGVVKTFGIANVARKPSHCYPGLDESIGQVCEPKG